MEDGTWMLLTRVDKSVAAKPAPFSFCVYKYKCCPLIGHTPGSMPHMELLLYHLKNIYIVWENILLNMNVTERGSAGVGGAGEPAAKRAE